MKKLLIIFISLAVLFSCATNEKTLVKTITVTSTASVKVKPDSATFSLSSESVKPTTKEAQAETNKMINDSIDLLVSEFNVDKDDIVTGYINVSPYYEWSSEGKRELIGQRASQSISVLVRNLDDLSAIIDKITTLDGIRLDGISVDKLDKTKEREEARELSVKASYDKALAYSKGANVKLGKVISLSDGSSVTYTPLYANIEMAKASDSTSSGSTSYYSGLVTIEEKVTVIYAIE